MHELFRTRNDGMEIEGDDPKEEKKTIKKPQETLPYLLRIILIINRYLAIF